MFFSNYKIGYVLFLSVALVLQSCFWDIGKIDINRDPFNNFDDSGNSQLEKDSEIIVLIPDIQYYTHFKQYHKILESMLDRINEINEKGYKVKAVVQVGDVTETNSRNEWETAKRIFGKLDGKNIACVLTTGNHDYGDSGTTNSRQTYFNDYFDFSSQTSFRSCYSDKYYENSLFEVTIHGRPLQLLSLEFGPRQAVIDWADSVLDKNKMSLLVTHAYLFKNKERFDWKRFGKSQSDSPYRYAEDSKQFGGENKDVNDGQDVWNKLVNRHENIRFVLCGHKIKPDYIGNLLSENSYKKNVLEMLFNTQNLPNGGDGWMQILEFKKDGKSLGVKTYSSLHNKWDITPTHQYTFFYNK